MNQIWAPVHEARLVNSRSKATPVWRPASIKYFPRIQSLFEKRKPRNPVAYCQWPCALLKRSSGYPDGDAIDPCPREDSVFSPRAKLSNARCTAAAQQLACLVELRLCTLFGSCMFMPLELVIESNLPVSRFRTVCTNFLSWAGVVWRVMQRRRAVHHVHQETLVPKRWYLNVSVYPAS